VTAADAEVDTALRARVVVASGASARAVLDALRGYCLSRSVRTAIHAALKSHGVDLRTLPERTPAEISTWKQGRQRHGGAAPLPDGYAVEHCECGREYPRMQSEAEGKCPKCWRKLVDRLARELEGLRAEADGLRSVG
jgi:hypothetical protein